VSEGETSLFGGAEHRELHFPSEGKSQGAGAHFLLVYILDSIVRTIKKTPKGPNGRTMDALDSANAWNLRLGMEGVSFWLPVRCSGRSLPLLVGKGKRI
jgi:hypothetical protein